MRQETLPRMQTFMGFWDTKCPACGDPKNRLHWVCIPCSEYAGNPAKPTQISTHLETMCAAHVAAIQLYMTKARERLNQNRS